MLRLKDKRHPVVYLRDYRVGLECYDAAGVSNLLIFPPNVKYSTQSHDRRQFVGELIPLLCPLHPPFHDGIVKNVLALNLLVLKEAVHRDHTTLEPQQSLLIRPPQLFLAGIEPGPLGCESL